MFRKVLIALVMCCSVAVVTLAASKAKFTLVIDAGHGGKDAGAKGASSYEKNINLKVALAFGKLVERNCPDVRVVYTRKTDIFIPLDERANIANRNKADLFISVHTNALPKGKIARGFEVYTLGMHRAADNLDVAKRENSVILVEKDYKQHYKGFDPNSSESYIMFEFMQDKNMAKSVELAKLIDKEVCAKANRPNKGVHQAGFLVLRATSMPSCLIELGFITTPDEEKLLNSESGIENHARGIYNAFLKYRKKYDSGAKGILTDANLDEKKTSNIVEKQKEKEIEKDKEVVAATSESETEKTSDSQNNETVEPPVFKVQILASDVSLSPGSRLFKGEKNVECFSEGNMKKYTVGASENYNEIYRLRKSLLSKFPQAFIIAFRNNEKMDVRQAILEYKEKRK